MINNSEKNIIISCAKKYDIEIVILFGSSINEDTDYRDIDIAVKGVKSGFSLNFMVNYIENFLNLLILLIYLMIHCLIN